MNTSEFGNPIGDCDLHGPLNWGQYHYDRWRGLATGGAYDILMVYQISGSGDIAATLQETVLATPLPGALALFSGGLGVIGLLSRQKKRSAIAV